MKRIVILSALVLVSAFVFGDDPTRTSQVNSRVKAQLHQARELTLAEKDVEIVECHQRIKNVVGVDQTIVRVKPVTSSRLLLTAVRPGIARLTITTENDQQQEMVVSVVAGDTTGPLAKTLLKLYPELDLTLHELQGSVLIRGEVNSSLEITQIIEICEQFYPSVLSHLTARSTASTNEQPPQESKIPVPGARANHGNGVPSGHLLVTIPSLENSVSQLADHPGSVMTIRDGASIITEAARVFAMDHIRGSNQCYITVTVPREKYEATVSAIKSGTIKLLHPARASTKESLLNRKIDLLHQDVKRLIKLLETRQTTSGASI